MMKVRQSYAVYKRCFSLRDGNVYYSYHDGPHDSMAKARDVLRRFYRSTDVGDYIIGVTPEYREILASRPKRPVAKRRKAKRRTPKRSK